MTDKDKNHPLLYTSSSEFMNSSKDNDIVNPSSSDSSNTNFQNRNPEPKGLIEKNLFKLPPIKSIKRSPLFIGSTVILFLMILFIMVPTSGIINIPYPLQFPTGTTSNDNGHIGLNSNTVYYTSEMLSAGSTISYNVNSNKMLSFAIFYNSINKIPRTGNRRTGIYTESFNITNSQPKFIPFFLFKDDKLSFNYTESADNTVRNINVLKSFGVQMIDQQLYYELTELNYPNTQKNPYQLYSYQYTNNVGFNNGSFNAPATGTWYLYFYGSQFNQLTARLHFALSINYAISRIDFSKGLAYTLNTANITQTTFTAPSTGNYTILIGLSSTIGLNKSTTAYYTIIFKEHLTSVDKWKEIDPILEIVSLVMVFFIILTMIQRIKYNDSEYQSNIQNNQASDEITKERNQNGKRPDNFVLLNNNQICFRCGSVTESDSKFCYNCGAKVSNMQN